jgi:hypothetical protein
LCFELSCHVGCEGKLLAHLHFLRLPLRWKNANVPVMWAENVAACYREIYIAFIML